MQGDSESPGHGHGHGHDHGYDLPRLSRNFDHASALAMEGSPGDHARTLQSRISPAKKTAMLTSIARLGLLLLALSVTPGCAGPESEARPAPSIPVAMAPELAGLLVRIHPEGSEIGREVALALGTELARAGGSVLADERRPSDAELRLSLDLRSLGIVVEGVTSLSVESGGVLLEVLHRRRGRLLVCALLVERRPAALGFTAAAIPG